MGTHKKDQHKSIGLPRSFQWSKWAHLFMSAYVHVYKYRTSLSADSENFRTNMFAKGISLVHCNIDCGVYNSSPLLDDVFFCIIFNVYQHSVIPRLELPFMYLVHKI